jgi:hypothetical protein
LPPLYRVHCIHGRDFIMYEFFPCLHIETQFLHVWNGIVQRPTCAKKATRWGFSLPFRKVDISAVGIPAAIDRVVLQCIQILTGIVWMGFLGIG